MQTSHFLSNFFIKLIIWPLGKKSINKIPLESKKILAIIFPGDAVVFAFFFQ